jgi:hypothetical protein
MGLKGVVWLLYEMLKVMLPFCFIEKGGSDIVNSAEKGLVFL